MENLTLAIIGIALLGVGIFSGFLMDAEVKCPTCEVCQICPACPATPACTVSVEKVCDATAADLVKKSVDVFINELEDEDELECKGDNYDTDQVSIYRVYDKYTISGDDDETTVDFSVKLKFDEDVEKSCHQKYDVSVLYEEDEDPEVTY